MAKYILLINWTDQGVKSVKDSPKRLDAARKLAETAGAKMGDFYMTIGGYDMVAHVDAPDDATVAKFVLNVGGGRKCPDPDAEGVLRGRISQDSRRALMARPGR